MKTNTLIKPPDYRKVTLTYKNQKFIILTIIPRKNTITKVETA